MPWWRKINRSLGFFALFCGLMLSVPTPAAGIKVADATGFRNNQGEFLISVIFRVELPPYLEKALKEGVPLHFVLDYDLIDSTYAYYLFTLKSWLGYTHQLQYRLTYHPLLNKYNLSIGGYHSVHNSLPGALAALGQLLNFNLTDALGKKPLPPGVKVTEKVRLAMSVKDLPKPFQVNILNAGEGIMNSGWVNLTVIGK